MGVKLSSTVRRYFHSPPPFNLTLGEDIIKIFSLGSEKFVGEILSDTCTGTLDQDTAVKLLLPVSPGSLES